MKVLSTQNVLLIHEDVINDGELQGLAGDKSLDAVNRTGRESNSLWHDS